MNPDNVGSKLSDRLRSLGLPPLNTDTARRFQDYISLFLRWNQCLNLSSVRDEDAIIDLHLVESIAVANQLPAEIATLLDFGSGGGLPGIPIALCRPEIAVTLAESQNKKAAFLQEAVRTLALTATVHAGRAEMIGATFDCVTLRAVDKMSKAVAGAAGLISDNGWLAVMTTSASLAQVKNAAGLEFSWAEPSVLPGSDFRLSALGRKVKSPD